MAPCQTICIHMDPPKEIKFQRPTFNRKTLRSDAKHSGLWVWCAKRRALLGSASCAVAAEASVQNYWRRQFCIVANNERRHTMRQEMRRQ